MNDTYLLGLDVGTTNLKAMLFGLSSRRILSLSQRTPVIHPGPAGWAQYDPEEIWHATVGLIRSAIEQIGTPSAVRALAVSSMGETGIPVAHDGRWVYPAIAWYDRRADSQAHLWQQQVGAERTYATTGLPPSASYGLLKLMWLKREEPELFAEFDRWLPIGDYIAYRLCGIQCSAYTLAWRTMAFDIRRAQWSEELLKAAGVDYRLMPELCPGGTPLGPIRPRVASITGLPLDCLVVAGGMDAICGMLAVGAIDPGNGLDILGSSELVLTTTYEPHLGDDNLATSLDVGPHVVPGRYVVFGGMTSAGSLVQWFVDLFKPTDCQEIAGNVFSQLTKEAEEYLNEVVPVISLPHFGGSRTPHSDPLSRGVIFGLTPQVNRGQLFLSILQALSFEARLITEQLEKETDCSLDDIWLAGGGVQSTLWVSLKANILGRDICLSSTPDISALGAVMLAGIGAGLFVDASEAVSHSPDPPQVVSPDPAQSSKQDRIYQDIYHKLYPASKEVSHLLAGLA
jgi:xylulokinase